MDERHDYEEFAKKMQDKYPKLLAEKFGGFAVGEGWWIILDQLMADIQRHIDSSEKDHIWDLDHNEQDIRPVCPQVVVQQIKEKFGALRFSYRGGDQYISGLRTMAESWAGNTCETCGSIGERRSGGWMRTLCDKHEVEYQLQHKDD